MDKQKLGNILGISSLLPVMISVIIFYTQRGPNVDIYFIINFYSILSVIGIVLAIISWWLSKRLIPLFIGLIGNVFVLGVAFFLLLAMGISEP